MEPIYKKNNPGTGHLIPGSSHKTPGSPSDIFTEGSCQTGNKGIPGTPD